MSHALPHPQKFMNAVLDPQIFEDQYCMVVCESFSRGAEMLQCVQTLKEEKRDLEDQLKTSQTITLELQCRVVNAERCLLEKEHVRALVKEKEKAWDKERAMLMREREQLVEDVNHYKVVASVSGTDVETLYAEPGIVQDDNKKLVAERHLLLSQSFGYFLAAFTQSPNFKGSLERNYQA
ncbi:hypothetical protein Hdeb2414_s0011g00370151 [Helianthus debilis subsp. tardiflorus]